MQKTEEHFSQSETENKQKAKLLLG